MKLTRWMPDSFRVNLAAPRAHVLVCDDETHIRAVIVAKLTSLGFSVAQGRNGAEGLSQALARTPALVITDYQMPVMSGMEMAKELRNADPTKDVPVLMLTARGYSLDPREVAGTGIREVIAKPFGVRQLMERVDAMIRGDVTAAEDDQHRSAA